MLSLLRDKATGRVKTWLLPGVALLRSVKAREERETVAEVRARRTKPVGIRMSKRR